MDPKTEPVAPGLEGEVGYKRAEQILGGTLDAAESAAAGNRPGGIAGEIHDLANAELLGEMLGSFFAIPGKIAEVSSDVPWEKVKPGDIWPLTADEKKRYGQCLRIILLQHGDAMIRHLPWVVLGAGLGLGILTRLYMVRKIATARKKADAPQPANPAPAPAPGPGRAPGDSPPRVSRNPRKQRDGNTGNPHAETPPQP